MATVAQADQAADLLQKLSIESQTKALEIPEPTRKPSANQFGSVDYGNTANGQIPLSDRPVTPLLQDFVDPSMCYLPNGYPSTAFYYGGYDGTGNDWEDYTRYVNPDGVEMTSGVYGDNGSMMYHHGYGYAPYGPYSPAASPVPTIGNDGQLYGPQHYQYPPYFQPLTPTSAPYTPSSAVPRSDISTSVAADQKPLPVETTNGNANGIVSGGAIKGNNGSTPLKPAYQNSPFNSNGSYARGPLPGRVSTPGFQDLRVCFDGFHSTQYSDAPIFSDWQSRPVTSTTIPSSISNGNHLPSARNQNYRPSSQFMGLHPRPLSAMNQGYMSRMLPNKMYGQYGNPIRSSMGFGYHGYDSRASGRGWLAVDGKYNKPRGRNGGYYGYGNESMDGLNELNRGPRAKGFKNQKDFLPATLAVKGQNLPTNATTTDKEKDKTAVIPDQEQYNKLDFPVEYADAKFFIIKSYSEDDVHKSIKYNVWASTPNGNKKLHTAYQEAQEKSGGCPVFFFFSVNTSGQFVGLAEMVGPVDFNKSVEYWQQDKWNGCFPVKWHIVKDVPNSLLKHITLENNENKPVTNSRDTQEVKLEPGLKLVKIFKEHSSKTCILDDFGFYETRQKTIQEKKAKQQQFQKQVWEGKPVDEKKEVANGELNQKTLEAGSDSIKDPLVTVHASDNGKVAEHGLAACVAPKGAKPVVSEKIVANGIANGC